MIKNLKDYAQEKLKFILFKTIFMQLELNKKISNIGFYIEIKKKKTIK